MNNYSTIVWLLIVVFMIHDFEEIIFFKSWLNKNKDYLAKKYPKISKYLPFFDNFSTSAFALAVAVLFILLSLITLGSVIFNNYVLWLAAFMVFFVHLFMHLGQWIILKRYVPAIWTTFFAFIYCFFALYEIISNNIFRISEIALWTFIGLVIFGPFFIFIIKLAEMFNKRQQHKNNN